MKKPCKDRKEEYKGVTFISYQSGSPDEPSKQLMEALATFVTAMQKEYIRVYTNLQIGTPHGGCGPPPKTPCLKAETKKPIRKKPIKKKK